jgi:hypothetical protein
LNKVSVVIWLFRRQALLGLNTDVFVQMISRAPYAHAVWQHAWDLFRRCSLCSTSFYISRVCKLNIFARYLMLLFHECCKCFNISKGCNMHVFQMKGM